MLDMVMRLSLEELVANLKVDDKGRLVLRGVRMLFITRDFIVALQKTAEEILGPMGAAALLYRAGLATAHGLAQTIAETEGLKGFEVLERSEEPVKAVVRLYNTVAEEWGNVGRAVCHLPRGCIAGVLKFVAESLGREVDVRAQETACMAKGDPYCEIVAEEAR
ncbi:hypothetical protein DRO33_01930 [Candidatus Bathyarchaeota archaeon]|nr:MAG: hypothetical protein DRO33_01930 [Candidatus Bathyarchaeota archaeon]